MAGVISSINNDNDIFAGDRSLEITGIDFGVDSGTVTLYNNELSYDLSVKSWTDTFIIVDAPVSIPSIPFCLAKIIDSNAVESEIFSDVIFININDIDNYEPQNVEYKAKETSWNQ